MLEERAVVFDNGSGSTKAGLAGEELPQSIFPTVVGSSKHPMNQSAFVGRDTLDKQCFLNLKYPVERGIVTNWDVMEKIWHHTFYNELRVAPEDQSLLICDAPFNPNESREKMSQVIFETFSVPAMYASMQPLLAAYASGRNQCVIVHSGAGHSNIVPIYEGYCIPSAITRCDVAGSDLTDYMAKMLKGNGASVDMNIVRDIKEQLCQVSLDFGAEMKKTEQPSDLERTYVLPDGNNINITQERIKCPEALFQPSLIGMDNSVGVQQAILSSIQSINSEDKRNFYSNIVLCGGTTMFEGIAERIANELTNMAPASMKIRVISPPDRKYSVWIGGSILASLSTFQTMWITKSEYEDAGPTIIHRKCF